jgi:1,4-dihydroxy-2-naphthoate octaprenyltransferase
MKESKAIMLLLRLPFLTVTVGAVFLGTAFALWNSGRFDLIHFLLALFGACFMHIACNVANDYFDHKSGNDAVNITGMTPFSGGSRMILEGFVKPEKALAVSFFFAFLGAAAGLYLNFAVEGNVVLIIGITALFLVYGYNGFPLYLVNKGLGEIGIFLAWGPLMVVGAYYVQTGSLASIWPFVVSIPSGILTTLVLLINEFADKEADASVGRKTWVILFGYKKSLYIFLFLGLVCFAVVFIGVLFDSWPLWTLLTFLTLPLAFQAFSLGLKNLMNWPGFLPVVKATILMNFLFLVILSIAFLV